MLSICIPTSLINSSNWVVIAPSVPTTVGITVTSRISHKKAISSFSHSCLLIFSSSFSHTLTSPDTATLVGELQCICCNGSRHPSRSYNQHSQCPIRLVAVQFVGSAKFVFITEVPMYISCSMIMHLFALSALAYCTHLQYKPFHSYSHTSHKEASEWFYQC